MSAADLGLSMNRIKTFEIALSTIFLILFWEGAALAPPPPHGCVNTLLRMFIKPT